MLTMLFKLWADILETICAMLFKFWADILRTTGVDYVT